MSCNRKVRKQEKTERKKKEKENETTLTRLSATAGWTAMASGDRSY
jgi:hypothetical protein